MTRTHTHSVCHPSASQRRGFNLVEAAIVLGVVGLVIGGIWTAASSVAHNQKVNESKLLIGQVYDNLRRLYAGIPLTGLGAIDGELLATVTPANFRLNATRTAIIGPFDEVISFAVDNSNRLFTPSISTSSKICSSLAPALMSQFNGQFKGLYPNLRANSVDVTDLGNISAACSNSKSSAQISFSLAFP